MTKISNFEIVKIDDITSNAYTSVNSVEGVFVIFTFLPLKYFAILKETKRNHSNLFNQKTINFSLV